MTPYEYKLKFLMKEIDKIPSLGGVPTKAIAQLSIHVGRLEFEAGWKMQFEYEPDDADSVIKLTGLLKERGLIE